jgi:FixJ family two-component response regulator
LVKYGSWLFPGKMRFSGEVKTIATSQDTVIIAEQDAKLFCNLEALIAQAGFKVFRYQNVETLLQPKCCNGNACVLILGDTFSLDFLGFLKESRWDMPVIVLHSASSISNAVLAIQSGAEDYISHPPDPETLLNSIQRAMSKARAQVHNNHANRKLLERARTLTRRECEIIQLVLAGMLNKQIAEHLGLALITVKVHRGRAMRKLGARTAGELASIVRELGLSALGLPDVTTDPTSNQANPPPPQ